MVGGEKTERAEDEQGGEQTAPNPFGLTFVHLSGRQIRVLAHPLRVRLLGHLRAEGAATATHLAEALATNSGATSYHLRQLAEAGLVTEEERDEGGRRRWWRAAHDMSSWRRADYEDDPDATAAVEWMETQQVNRFVETAQAWWDALPGEPVEWRDAGEISDYLLSLDLDQLRALMAEVGDVIERHRVAAQADPRPGARPIVLYSAALPGVNEPGGRRTTD